MTGKIDNRIRGLPPAAINVNWTYFIPCRVNQLGFREATLAIIPNTPVAWIVRAVPVAHWRNGLGLSGGTMAGNIMRKCHRSEAGNSWRLATPNKTLARCASESGFGG